MASAYMQSDVRIDMSSISNGGVFPVEPVETKKTSVISWLGKNYLAVILAFALGGVLVGFGIFVLFRGI
jgi:hypothetical protein